jgi:PPM family protein phosphatase
MPQHASFTEASVEGGNQDAFLIATHPRDSNLWLAVIADGQGGRAGGAEAAKRGCEAVIERASASPVDQLQNPLVWAELIRMADRAIHSDTESGYTTLVALGLRFGQVVGASQGDSAVFAQHDGSFIELTQNQRKNPPIGSGEVRPRSFQTGFTEPWLLMLMTDGVWKYVGHERLAELTAKQRATDLLLTEIQELARLKTSGRFQDDFTILAFSEPQNG